eukprot:4382367-Pleurochrysis_carterae.AAC.4
MALEAAPPRDKAQIGRSGEVRGRHKVACKLASRIGCCRHPQVRHHRLGSAWTAARAWSRLPIIACAASAVARLQAQSQPRGRRERITAVQR